MSVFAATDFTVSVAGTDLTDHCSSVTTDFSVADLDTTAFGDDWTTRIGGLKSGNVSLNFHQDYASSSVDSTLWTAFNTVVEVVVKPTSGAVSATNPSYTFDVLVTQVATGGAFGGKEDLNVQGHAALLALVTDGPVMLALSRPESLRLHAATDPHSPPKYRINGVVVNMPEFAKAFSCKADAAMVKPTETICLIW